MEDNVDIRSELDGVLGGAILVAAGTLLSVGLDVAARAVFARVYTPEEYGVFSLSFTLFMIFSLVACLGLQNGLPRQIAFEEADGSGQVGTAGSQILWTLVLAGAVGLAISALLYQFNQTIAIRAFNDASYAQPIALIAVAIPLFTLIRAISAVFRGYSRPYERVIFQGLMRNVAFLGLLGLVAVLGLDHLTAITMLPISLALTTVLYLGHLYCDNPGRFRDGILIRITDIEVPISLVRFSYPLMVSTLLMQLMTWMDILMLGYFDTSRAVGLYDGVRPLIRIIPIVWQGMIFMYIPLVSNLFAQDHLDSIKRSYFILTKWFASATVPLGLLFLFFPESTLRAVFGPSFTVAAPALQLLAVAFCAGNVIGPTGATLIAMGYTRVLMLINLVSASTNFGLNILMIPEIGLLDAAIATAVAIILRNLLRLTLLYYKGGIHAIEGELYKPILLTASVTGTLSLGLGSVSGATLVVLFVVLTSIFIASFPLTDSISHEDGVLVSYITSKVQRITSFRT